MNRVTWRVVPWRNRYRGAVLVDDHEIAHRFFDSECVAQEWCEARKHMAEAEMRVR